MRAAIEIVFADPTRVNYNVDLRALLNDLREFGFVLREFNFPSHASYLEAVVQAISWVSTNYVKRILKEYQDRPIETLSALLFPVFEENEEQRNGRAALLWWFDNFNVSQQCSLIDNGGSEPEDQPRKRHRGKGGVANRPHPKDQFGRSASSKIPFMTRFSLYLQHRVESLSADEKHAFIDARLAEDREKFKDAKSTTAKDKNNADSIDNEEGSDESADESAE
ncbi:hypothetical protein HK096_000326, partial [Nowakowskiella sp. JEL0078]